MALPPHRLGRPLGHPFFPALANSKPILKGTLLSLFPTAVQLFVIFPLKANKGIAGLELGALTPLLVIGFNWVWGVVAALAIRYAR